MSENEKLLGSDLMLSNMDYGADLTLTERDRKRIEKRKEFGDLDVVSGAFNLGQAILSRLRTRKGELSDLGYPDYGSRLYELIGEPNNERTRELVRLITQETLLQEPRIKEIVNINVRTFKQDLSRIDIEITVVPIGSTTPLSVVYPFYLEVT
jgi:phage baseplate assembly protein W